MKFRNFFLLALLMPVATVFAQEDAEAVVVPRNPDQDELEIESFVSGKPS